MLEWCSFLLKFGIFTGIKPEKNRNFPVFREFGKRKLVKKWWFLDGIVVSFCVVKIFLFFSLKYKTLKIVEKKWCLFSRFFREIFRIISLIFREKCSKSEKILLIEIFLFFSIKIVIYNIFYLNDLFCYL